MKKIVLAFSLLVFCSVALFAQAPKDILDKAASAITQNGGVSVDFSIKSSNSKSKSGVMSQSGKAWIKGNKFKLVSSEGTTWFDGKTQWTYVKANNEVNVSNPDGEELAGISPVSILGLYKSGFKLDNKGVGSDRGRAVYKIEMTPQKKNSSVNKYIVNIDRQNYQITSITLNSRNGNNVVIALQKYQTGQNLSDKTFVFEKKEYPRAEIVDLR